jgi:hypothetical protein
MSRILWIIGLAVLMVNPIGYAGPKTVGSGGRQPPQTIPQDGQKQEQSAQKKLKGLKQQKQKSKQQLLQILSNISKMMHDTAMAIIRKIG